MKVPLLDLRAQWKEVEADVRREIDEVLESQHFILGPKVEALEVELARYCGVKHAVAVSSGTDAILAALMALGIGPGDEVVTSPYTFFATAGCVARLGARPVFVDVHPATMNLVVESVAAALTPHTRAVMPVHLFGRCADVPSLRRLTDPLGIPVVEDAAQALGAELGGVRAGALGAAGCFSFFPTKNLGACGDGGAVTTNDDQLASKLRVLRGHGASPKYFHAVIGGNFRLDALQAAVLLAKLPHLDRWTARRQKNAAQYATELRARQLTGPTGPVALPPAPAAGERHVWNQYVVRVENRDALMAHLKKNEVQTEVYYPRPMHLQECFASLGHRPGAFPVAEACAVDSLALPLAPETSPEAISFVAGAIADFYAAG
jgi:dTDP-4-amino-4,6-dideoxygalactose transaminase